MSSTRILRAYDNLFNAITNSGASSALPAGWYTSAALQRHWAYDTIRAASSRAGDYYIKGLFIRKQFKKVSNGKACIAFAYYPSAKYKSLAECDAQYKIYNVDKIPAGWISVRALKHKYKISKSCVHDWIERSNLEYKILKAPNKLGGYCPMMFIKLDKFKKIYEQRS